MPVTLTVIAMPATLSMTIIFSERRRYRQTAYQ
jgi:hypothetical protein